jgi:lipopolysaccharide transport system permease protein
MTVVINNQNDTFASLLKEVIYNKFIIFELFKKDLKTSYAQSLLGPFYFILYPFIQTFFFNFLLTNFGKFNTANLPSFIFYLSGITLWNFISISSIKCSEIYNVHRKVLGKLYINKLNFFISALLISCVHFFINFIIFIIILIYYKFIFNAEISFSIRLFLLIPLMLFVMLLSLAIGLVISSLSLKYKDVIYGLNFIFQILMLITPVLFSVQSLDQNLYYILYLNPFASLIECFRWIFFKDYQIIYSLIFCNIIEILILFILGAKMFVLVQKRTSDLI